MKERAANLTGELESQKKDNSVENCLNIVTSQQERPGWVECSGQCVNVFVCSCTVTEQRDMDQEVKVTPTACCIQMCEYSHFLLVTYLHSPLKVKRAQEIGITTGVNLF